MSASSALQAGRRAAESLMIDTCVINKMTKSKTIDDTTGEYPMVPTVIYSGRCKFTVQAVQVRDVDTQGQALDIAGGILAIPVTAAGSAAVAEDHVATITLAANDTVTITAIVQSGHAQSFATARRFPVEITT